MISFGFKLRVAAISLMFFASCAGSVGTARAQRAKYIHCNIYLSEACFGVAQGDEVVLSIPADFLRYEIKLGGGIRSLVYSGYNPDIFDASLASSFEACLEAPGVCSYSSEDGTGIEAVYSGSRSESTVHVLIDDLNDSNRERAREFLSNFRPCKSHGQSLTCAETKIFVARPS